jgi:hypothetical protein
MGNLYLEVDDDLEDGQKLWRYMDLSKFISLIDKKALWLARADTFRDKHEGRFPDDMRKLIEQAYKTFDDDGSSIVKDADDFQDYLRKNTYISCWHKNFDENMVMWEIYGRDTNALAIQTTVERMKESLDPSPLSGHSLILKNVSYKRADEIPGALPYEECCFIKRPHFSFEEEVRISLDTYSRFNPIKRTPYGYHLPVLIIGLIERILIHPDSPDWFADVVTSITRMYEVHATVERGQYGTK